MKSWRIVVVLLLCLALVGSMACSPFGGGDEQEASQQLVEVVRGDLTVSVSGSGRVEVANEARLAFGSGGRADEIYVNEGDKVSEGDVLARLDTSALELALARSQVALSQADAGLTQTQAGLAQARVSLQTAEDNLEKAQNPYTDEEIEDAEDAIEEAEDDLDFAKDMRAQALREGDALEIQYWKREVYQAQAELIAAEDELVAMLAPSDEDSVALAEMQVEAAKSQIEADELHLEAAELQLETAEQAVAEAEKQLDEATLIALFDGIVVSVNADEGDIVSTATTIVHLIDLTSMELRAGVDEIDIPSVKPNQRAIIEVDALPDLQLEGRVTLVCPLPTVEAGLVIYDVTIGFDVPEDPEVRVGMSATADIIINERSNVLLVPDRAIKHDSQGNPVVKVMVGEQIRARPVVIGISDGFQTEIVSGLSEGDTVVIELRAVTEPSSSGGGFFGH